ncbi:pyruvate decarboxylase [Chloropicon primus]|uniref:pyruvate decarboxylase n=1 Tax=Chloropicon primus TaxID=1764295 RepID=A0A5B8MW86_9CHLO|nr:pyruvate decarboxylase [Chloropicon primus]UPR03005.1 pyruvate decarboxylase [Chloropicon primus]|mmetsp:Transcript_14033/g.39699  ORF Transcript_14033/g.39699 Transcript_14033/m.39699 type:complete len:573 (+) Transcript_14033:135-1853(+)|eukprot:QDZ23792.1 pyruvate decarboxylase [Chloropicon primus]
MADKAPLPSNIGTYLGRRFVEFGVEDFFCVPGDYNLVLLDQLLVVPGLRMINCCNELNAGYAADGYARVKGVGVLVVTFTVGGLSAINAVAGAYSDNLPLVVISGGPNSNDFGTERVLHHTIGHPNFRQTLECYKQVTCHQAVIKSMENAAQKIDESLEMALKCKKPVYIEVACNLSGVEHGSLLGPRPLIFPTELSNESELHACVDDILGVLSAAVKPVLVSGCRIRKHDAKEALKLLADACGYAFASMPNGKGMIDEDHPNYIGTYWGQVSDPYVCETVESADFYLFIGPVFNDYTTTGYSTLVKEEKMIMIRGREVSICGRKRYHGVRMADVLELLSRKVKKNDASMKNFERMFVPPGNPPALGKGEKLQTNVLMHHIQALVTEGNFALCVETGDSWFNGQKLRLPKGTPYEFQMQYGSIGWSVGATLGMSTALKDERRVLALIGDGSFQMTAQDVSSMVRFGANPLIILINNDGYTIEVEIHDGPYNNILQWDYCKMVDAVSNGQTAFTYKVTTETEAEEALRLACSKERSKHLNFIECMIDRDDCSKELLEWGSRVAAANGRPPSMS